MRRSKKGISLIVLVITIIVMIILAAAVMISLSNTGILDKANEAVDETNLKEVEQLALLAWGEAYADGARTEAELQAAVDAALKDVDTSKYNIQVTDKGVIVEIDDGLGWPIAWNSMDVIGNLSVTTDGVSLVKISDYIPSTEDLENVVMTYTDFIIDTSFVEGGTVGVSSREVLGDITSIAFGDNAAFGVFTVSVAGKCEEWGINFPETGIYTINYGSLGIDADFSIGLSPAFLAIPEITLSNNILYISQVRNALEYEVYLDDELIITTTARSIDLSDKLNETTNCFISVRAATTEKYLGSDVATIWCSESMTKPGLYDNDDKLLASWAELVFNYGMDSTFFYTGWQGDYDYKDFLCSPYNVFNKDELSSGTKLIIGFGSEIGHCAFSECINLTNVIISNNVTKIDSFAFNDCTSLTTVTIPSSVTSIEDVAFYRCKLLTNIIFDGTVEQWNAISLKDSWIEETPATEVICSDGTVPLS